MRHILLGTMLLALCAPALAQASTYQWRDDDGVTHFTDNPDRIPDRYLRRARELESVKADPKPAIAAPSKTPAQPAAAPAPAAATAVPDAALAVKAAEQARLSSELKKVKDGLVVKRKELARLHHKWSVAKGRIPTEEEIEEFEKKRAKGKATFKDNPYVSRNPLSSPIPARIAYYKMLEAVNKDEEMARQLEQDLHALR